MKYFPKVRRLRIRSFASSILDNIPHVEMGRKSQNGGNNVFRIVLQQFFLVVVVVVIWIVRFLFFQNRTKRIFDARFAQERIGVYRCGKSRSGSAGIFPILQILLVTVVFASNATNSNLVGIVQVFLRTLILAVVHDVLEGHQIPNVRSGIGLGQNHQKGKDGLGRRQPIGHRKQIIFLLRQCQYQTGVDRKLDSQKDGNDAKEIKGQLPHRLGAGRRALQGGNVPTPPNDKGHVNGVQKGRRRHESQETVGNYIECLLFLQIAGIGIHGVEESVQDDTANRHKEIDGPDLQIDRFGGGLLDALGPLRGLEKDQKLVTNNGVDPQIGGYIGIRNPVVKGIVPLIDRKQQTGKELRIEFLVQVGPKESHVNDKIQEIRQHQIDQTDVVGAVLGTGSSSDASPEIVQHDGGFSGANGQSGRNGRNGRRQEGGADSFAFGRIEVGIGGSGDDGHGRTSFVLVALELLEEGNQHGHTGNEGKKGGNRSNDHFRVDGDLEGPVVDKGIQGRPGLAALVDGPGKVGIGPKVGSGNFKARNVADHHIDDSNNTDKDGRFVDVVGVGKAFDLVQIIIDSRRIVIVLVAAQKGIVLLHNNTPIGSEFLVEIRFHGTSVGLL